MPRDLFFLGPGVGVQQECTGGGGIDVCFDAKLLLLPGHEA